MHENHHLDDIIEENEKLGTYPPDRQRFESDLENIHTEMQKTRNQIQLRCKKCIEANPRRDEMKAQRRDYRKELNSMNSEDFKIKEAIDAKRKVQLDLEKDCRFRNRDQLEKVLAEHESRYANKSLPVRGEQALVNEIDALKRNRAKLEKLEELLIEKRDLEKRLKENRFRKNEVYHAVNTLQFEINKSQAERKEIENEIDNFREDIINMKNERQKLIDSYEVDRAQYKAWVSEKKGQNGTAIPMSFPTVKKTKTFVDDEELEPFFEQKRDCKRLIHYLEQLKVNVRQDDLKRNSDASKIESEDDSADELPPNLAKLNVSSKPSVLNATTNRKHLKRGTQPISHNIDIYKLFGTVEVDVPKVYSDVADALNAVQEKLDFYEHQTTNVLDWEEELKEFKLISKATSDMGSTIYEDSDVASVASNQRTSSRQSCQSPQTESPRRVNDASGCAQQ